MTSRRRRVPQSEEFSLQPHVTSVIPHDIYKRKMSPLMTQSYSKAGVGLMENFVVAGWEGSSRPNSSSHAGPKGRQGVQPNTHNLTKYGRKPKKPIGANRQRPAPGVKVFTSTASSTTNPKLPEPGPNEPTLERVVQSSAKSTATTTGEGSVESTSSTKKDAGASDLDGCSNSISATPETTSNESANRASSGGGGGGDSSSPKSAKGTASGASLSNIFPVYQLQRPLPDFTLPSNDRSLKVITVQYQAHLRQQGKLMAKNIERLNRAHEIDLANVILAYDTRMETLERRIDVHKSNNSKLQTMLDQAKHISHEQRVEIKALRQKIKLQEVEKSSRAHFTTKGTPFNSPILVPSIATMMESPPEMWIGQHQQHGVDGSPEDEYGRRKDSNMSDWDVERRTSNMSDFNSTTVDVDSAEVMRMREEIKQYQEALAEASKTIEDLESNKEMDSMQKIGETNGLMETVKMLERRAAAMEDELETEGRIRARAENQLEKSLEDIEELQAKNEKYKKDAIQMRAESARVRQEVAASEARINAQLQGAAVQMKKTLKQCHMLEELIRPEITCNSCFDILENAQVLYPCGHSFCDKCIDQMERPEDSMVVCLVCQALVPRVDTCPNVSLQAICPRVAWWSEPISTLKQIFHDFSGKDFVAQQTFAGGGVMETPSAASSKIPVADAKTTKILIRIAGAVKETGKNVATLFEQFDDDHGGTVDYDELEAGLKSINIWLPPNDFQALLSFADPNGDGEIEYHEFAELLDHMMTMREGRDHTLQRGAAALDPMVSSARSKGY